MEGESRGFGDSETADNSVGIEVLEKMLDEFDELYNCEKGTLANKLCEGTGYSERKITLDDFFGKIEERA